MARVSSAALAKRDLTAFGYAHLSPELLDPERSGCTQRQVEEFVGSWNALPRDPYTVNTGAASRERRYSRFTVLEQGIRALPPAPFVQSNEVNPIFGGIERRFAAVDPAIAASPVLFGLIRAVSRCLPAPPDEIARLNVGIHQIRIRASVTADGLPTPEGIHQDGHRFVAQVLVGRNAVDGGRSSFYDDGATVYQTYLTQPFECLLVDDRRLYHGVSAIRPAGAELGWRDMLLLDFPENPAPQASTSMPADEQVAYSLVPEDALGG